MAENEQPGFEESLKKLEKIVAEMESGDLSLDEMMRHFEEGRKLSEFCSVELTRIRQRIEKVVKGGTAVEPLDLDSLKK